MVSTAVWEEILREGEEHISAAKQSKERELEEKLIKQANNPRYATIVTGVRRSGKSKLLLRVASKLTSPVFYVNFEDERFIGGTIEDLTTFTKYKDLDNATVILDEVQAIPQWEKWARRIIDRGKTKLYISGSNASLLSGEFATLLTGRTQVTQSFPFSYREYRKHVGKNLELYLTEGGFPEAVLMDEPELTKQYRQDILYKDIITRHKIREAREMEVLFFHVLENPGILYSKKRLAPFVNVSHVTLKKFLHYIEQTFAVNLVEKYARSAYEKKNVPPKVYPMDSGLVTKKENKGRLLEGLVFQELSRLGVLVSYVKEPSWEIDFAVDKNIGIQVCYQLTEENHERELKPFKHAKFKKQLFICMYGYETMQFPEDVQVVSAESFLLEPSKYLQV